MLKTNSTKARENIRKYIIDRFHPEGYTDNSPQEFPEVARFILATFRNKKYNTIEDYRYYRRNERAAFEDWSAGLPSVLDTCYYYNRSAVDDLGAILEESEKEKARYDEEEAKKRLTSLIYRELLKGAEQL